MPAQILTAATFGPLLTLSRAHAQKSQVKVALEIGASPSRIGRLESSVCDPRPNELKALAAALPMLARIIEDGEGGQ